VRFSLGKLNFIAILITTIIFTITIGIFTVKIITDSYKNRITQLEDNYIEKNKKLIKNEVYRTISRIKVLENISYKILRNSLEEKVNLIYDLLKNNSKNRSKKELITYYKKYLDSFKWDQETGYFYIFDDRGTIIYHGANSNYENKNILNLMKENKELESFIKDTIKKDSNFGSYKWYKPNEKVNQLYKKYVYVKKVKKYNIYIAAGIYKSEFQKSVQKLAFNELEKERFGEDDYGYFWIHSLSNEMIMHPTRKELLNKDLTDFKTLDGQYLFKNMKKIISQKQSGYISYIWYKPNTNIQDEKISFIHLIKEWDMVVGSGFYLTELKDILQKEKQKLSDSLKRNLEKIFLVLLGLILLILIIAYFISKKITKIEIEQKEHFNMLEQYQLILDKSAVVSKTNEKGIITYVNDNFVKISGYSKDEAIGKPHNIVRHPETPKNQFKKLWDNIQKGNIWKGILKNKKKNGDSYYNNTTIVPIKNSEGKILEYISSGSDVTEIFENRTKLQNIFKTDSLTGLGNRVSLIDEISKSKNGVLALINIDRFKQINDIHGHKIGDLIIKQLAQRLFKYIEDAPYLIYRVQGDIFALLTKKEKLNDMVKKLEKFINNIGKKPYIIKNESFILTYTCGIANDTQNLFTYADMALGEAKNKKIQIKIFDESMNNIDEFKQNILWVDKLHKAIAEDRIVPYFQGIYNYHTKKIDKYECLMRLIEDDKAISPIEYLDIAKKTKLYPELTYKIAGKAITKFANLKEEFSINLSAEDLMNEKLMAFIYDYAEQKNVFNTMILEIVESEEIEDSDQISTTIKKFKDKGCKIAIDDFGSGYSNYEYLISLQADYIKIDGSITKYILEDERTAEVVKSIVNFAKKSNMKTIAEFVSTKELDQKLRELGVDYAQGWFYGKAEKDLIT